MADENGVDEWTFVPVKHNRHASSSKSQKINDIKKQKQLAKAKELMKAIDGHDDNDDGFGMDETIPKHIQVSKLSQSVQKCMNELQSFTNSSRNQQQSNMNSYTTKRRSKKKSSNSNRSMNQFHFKSLLQSLQSQCDDNNRIIDEIICYGIGNFAKKKITQHNMRRRRPSNISSSQNSSDLELQYIISSSPMIQISCILLLRQYLAETKMNKMKNTDNQNHNHVEENHKLSYEEQQDLVPISYFEPCIFPIEKLVLEEIFHVHIIHENERGKRCIRRGSDSNSNENETHHFEEENSENTSAQVKQHKQKPENSENDSAQVEQHKPKPLLPSTLFYMPHCPMRLYSNTLWANWDPKLLCEGRIIIFGNSFKAYDDRIISFQQKKDSTNAIFPLLSFINEVPVLSSFAPPAAPSTSSTASTSTSTSLSVPTGNINVEPISLSQLSWQEVEMAFNDCVIISISMKSTNSPIESKNSSVIGIHNSANHNDHVENGKVSIWPVRPDEHHPSLIPCNCDHDNEVI